MANEDVETHRSGTSSMSKFRSTSWNCGTVSVPLLVVSAARRASIRPLL